jgi:hypothetical protein
VALAVKPLQRPGTSTPEATVSRWIDAVNAWDLDAMLGCLDPEVELHPLRLWGLVRAYRGHDGVARWFSQMLADPHRIVIVEIRTVDDQVVASGGLRSTEQEEISPFCGLYRLTHGLIVTAHHYMSDLRVLEHLGLGPSR